MNKPAETYLNIHELQEVAAVIDSLNQNEDYTLSFTVAIHDLNGESAGYILMEPGSGKYVYAPNPDVFGGSDNG